MLVAMNPNATKPITGFHAVVDVTKLNDEKLRLFATAYNEYFKKVIWSDGADANDYLVIVGKTIVKYFDIVCNIAKFYCYEPTDKHKDDMRNGILATNPDIDLTSERPELRNVFLN